MKDKRCDCNCGSIYGQCNHPAKYVVYYCGICLPDQFLKKEKKFKINVAGR
jgi:hypothetical protein